MSSYYLLTPRQSGAAFAAAIWGMLPHTNLTQPKSRLCLFLHSVSIIQKPPNISVCELRERHWKKNGGYVENWYNHTHSLLASSDQDFTLDPTYMISSMPSTDT